MAAPMIATATGYLAKAAEPACAAVRDGVVRALAMLGDPRALEIVVPLAGPGIMAGVMIIAMAAAMMMAR